MPLRQLVGLLMLKSRRQPEARGESESKEHHFSNGYETGGEDCAMRSENGEAAWGEVEAKFRAHRCRSCWRRRGGGGPREGRHGRARRLGV